MCCRHFLNDIHSLSPVSPECQECGAIHFFLPLEWQPLCSLLEYLPKTKNCTEQYALYIATQSYQVSQLVLYSKKPEGQNINMAPPLVESLKNLVLQVLATSLPLDKERNCPMMEVYQGKTVSLTFTSHPHPPAAPLLYDLHGRIRGSAPVRAVQC